MYPLQTFQPDVYAILSGHIHPPAHDFKFQMNMTLPNAFVLTCQQILPVPLSLDFLRILTRSCVVLYCIWACGDTCIALLLLTMMPFLCSNVRVWHCVFSPYILLDIAFALMCPGVVRRSINCPVSHPGSQGLIHRQVL